MRQTLNWFAWLAEENILAENMAAKLELPKEGERLPLDALSVDQVEEILQGIDVTTSLGIRNRAILETF